MGTKRKGLTGWPEDWSRAWVPDDEAGYGRSHGCKDTEELIACWEQFADYHEMHGSRFASWPAAWRTWCRNAQRYAQERKPIGFVVQGPQLQSGTATTMYPANVRAAMQEEEQASAAARAERDTPAKRQAALSQLSEMIRKVVK